MLAPPRGELDPGEDRAARRRPARRRAVPGTGGALQPDGARPIARHGLNARKTSPKSTLANAIPTQNDDQHEDRREVRERVVAGRGSRPRSSPRAAATPSAPQHDLDRLASRVRGQPGSGRQRSCSSRGVDHSSPSAAKETTSTTAAAQPNSHSGIGRFARWTRPWACAPRQQERCREDGAERCRPFQRRIAKKTWSPLLQRKVILLPVKLRQAEPARDLAVRDEVGLGVWSSPSSSGSGRP